MKILLFAGTTEGRMLGEKLLERYVVSLHICVATDYGAQVLREAYENQSFKGTYTINPARLSERDMEDLMTSGFDFVVDATHPYAKEVTLNIRQAAEQAGISYLRLLRAETGFGQDCIFVSDTQEAAALIDGLSGNVLLAVGSKELKAYTSVRDYRDRLFARVLPMEDVVRQCRELGFSGQHLICMQGPFSKDLNVAMLKQYDCKYLVTKDTGKAGGAEEKYEAAREAGAGLIVIGRGTEEQGMSLEDVVKTIGEAIGGKSDGRK